MLTPIELGLRAAHRATGRWSLRALPSVIAYRRPLTRRMILLIPVLFLLALAIYAAFTPVGNTIGGALTGIYPHWLIAGNNALQHYWRPWNWLVIFGLGLILTTLVVRLRCVRLGIVMHILADSFGLLVTLVGVLS